MLKSVNAGWGGVGVLKRIGSVFSWAGGDRIQNLNDISEGLPFQFFLLFFSPQNPTVLCRGIQHLDPKQHQPPPQKKIPKKTKQHKKQRESRSFG